MRRQRTPALHNMLSAATAAVALLVLLAPAANAQYQVQRVTTNTAAVILAQIPNTTSYIISSRLPLDSGELAGFFDIGTQRVGAAQGSPLLQPPTALPGSNDTHIDPPVQCGGM